MAKKTWREKVETQTQYELVDIPPKMQPKLGLGKMLIPRPMDIEAIVKTIKKGQVVTLTQIRESLAKKYKANITCPLCSGIFLNIVAKATEEDRMNGKKDLTPYWRVIKDNGKLNEKFPIGANGHAQKLQEEGFQIEPGKGKQPPKVKSFDAYLVKSDSIA